MGIDLLNILLLAGIICFSSMIQSAVGFGIALFATPLLLQMGIPLPSVIIIMLVCSMIQSAMGIFRLRQPMQWKLSSIAVLVRIIGIISGIFILKFLLVTNVDNIKMIVGYILCLSVVLQLFCKQHPVEKLHWGWGGLAFTASGLLSGVCGMGGPPLVLWVMAHNWSTKKIRSFMFGLLIASSIFQIILMRIFFGDVIYKDILIGICLAPVIYLGVHIGIPLGHKMSKKTLRRVAYVILLGIAIASIV